MEIVVRATASASEAQQWALVLAAADISHRLDLTDAGWRLLVAPSDAPQAHEALDAYDEEARADSGVSVPESAPGRGSWAVGIAVGALLLAFFGVTGPPGAGSRWFAQGAASAQRIVDGEPWRAVTALTLHLDLVHVISNAAATAVFLTAVVGWLGPGCGLWLTLLAGVSANLLGAVAHGPGHVAVGASTATFGAIGILAGLRLVRDSTVTRTRSRPWTVLAAALLLLAMLGTSRGSDVLGHALGLLCGGVLGLGSGVAFRARVGGTLRRPIGPIVQWALVVLVALVVIGGWLLALTGADRSS